MTISSMDVAFSLRMALELGIPEITKAQIVSESTDWSSLSKPFVTVDYLDQTPELLTAGRTGYRDTFYYQVGLFAESELELRVLEDKVREVIRKSDGHFLYTYIPDSKQFTVNGDKIVFDDGGFTPIDNDDYSEIKYDFHGYFDVEVEHIS